MVNRFHFLIKAPLYMELCHYFSLSIGQVFIQKKNWSSLAVGSGKYFDFSVEATTFTVREIYIFLRELKMHQIWWGWCHRHFYCTIRIASKTTQLLTGRIFRYFDMILLIYWIISLRAKNTAFVVLYNILGKMY